MYNIVLIGSGQLGSRHLQGLKKAALDMTIQIVDANQESLNLAKQRYEEIPESRYDLSINCLHEIDELSDSLDLVIIATGSSPRAAIIKELLSKRTVKNIILEKFLFSNLEDYDQVYDLLTNTNLLNNTWVNCPRRMFASYHKLQKEFDSTQKVEYIVEGGDWGLACNAIHFIDHFAWLTNDENILSFDTIRLDKVIHESRRAGYIELTGTLSGKTVRGNEFTLTSMVDSSDSVLITIHAGNDIYQLDESAGKIIKNGNLFSELEVLFQSELTGILAEDILLRNQCSLTSYAESSGYHKSFLKAITCFYNAITGKINKGCPIT